MFLSRIKTFFTNLLKESDLRSECQLIRVKQLKDVKKCNRKVDEVIFRSIFFVPFSFLDVDFDGRLSLSAFQQRDASMERQ